MNESLISHRMSILEIAAVLLLAPVLVSIPAGIVRLLGWVALLLSLSAVAAPPPLPAARTLKAHPIETTNRVLLVKPKVTTTPAQVEALRGGLNLRDETRTKRLKWRQFVIPPGQFKHETIAKLKASGLFEHVIEPQTYTTQAVPNDPMFGQLWGVTNIAAPLAWDRIKDAPDIVVAVVDTGIDFNHPDLAANLWTGPNGEHGYTATNGTVIPGGIDDHGHGTHVAGTIGAVGNNGIGVVGLAWKTKIIAIKVLHNGSGNSIDIVNGYEKMIDLRESGVPLLVSNHSYGGSGPDPIMEDGFRLLAEADLFCAVAAGNSSQNIDLYPIRPAVYTFDNMVVALASDSAGKTASFSSFGIISTDISAPGVGILSTTRNNTYSLFSGTSMATPHVAGLAALVRQLNRSLTASQTREVILHPGSYDAGNYFSSTGGKINAAKTVNNPKLFEQPFQTNHPPRIESVTPYTLIRNTQPVMIQATGSDADGDPLKWNSSLSALNSTFERRVLSNLFVSNVNNLTVVAGGPYAYQLASGLTIGVSDGRGGSTTTNSGFEFARDAQFRRPIPLRVWTVSTNAGDPERVTITLDVDDPAKSNYVYGLIMNFPGNRFGSYWALNPSPTPFLFHLGGESSAFSIRAFVMDRWLNYLVTETVSVRTNSLALLPKCIVTTSTNEANIPFNMTFDLSKSERVQFYAVYDWFLPHASGSGPVQTNHFDTPAMHFRMPLVYGTTPGEIDLTIVPVFASRFLGAAPPPQIAQLAVQRASKPDGPWTTFTNVTDAINGDTFYRLEAQ